MHRFVRQLGEALAALEIGVDAPVCVGCSGGPDSAALADAAMALARAGRLGPVTVVHVDHRLRPGSAAEAARVQRLAEHGGGQFRGVAVEVAGGASLERAAREARLAALEAVAREVGAAAVLLGHTASDQAETVLMRVIRGTGPTGLSGIPRRRGRFVRPLLERWRHEVEAYVADRQLDVLADPMNRDPRFFRGRVRQRWLPALREENPALDEALCRLADAAGAEREVLDWAAQALLARARRGRAEYAAAALADAPSAVVRRALAMAAEQHGTGSVDSGHLTALEALVRRPSGGTLAIDLPRQRAWRIYERLRFGDEVAPAPPEVAIEGSGGPYHVRLWQPGDRMCPARLRGRSRKLSDLYTDARIPREWRVRARVVVRDRDGFIEWAEHIGHAHGSSAKVSLTTPDPAAIK